MPQTLMRVSVVFLFALIGSSCGEDAPEWTPLPPLEYGKAPSAVDADAFFELLLERIATYG